MAQASTDPTRLRYTIPQLLQLSGQPCISCDLSKFTFDAARAGVVQSLTEYAVNSRRTSAHRLRENSNGSTMAVEPSVHNSRVQTMHLIRSPRLPPVDLRAQKDQGFAHFLKKHASPTHKRVTAGGRIVPMEPRASPPAFQFAVQGQVRPNVLANTARNLREQEIGHSLSPQTSGESEQQQALEFKNTTMADNTPYANAAAAENQAPIAYDSPNPLPVPANQPPNQFHMNRNINPAMSLGYTGIFPGNAGPYYNVMPGMPYNMYAFPNMGMYPYSGMQSWGPPPTPVNPGIESQSPSFAQQGMINYEATAASSLAYWTQCFDELDRQLKMLDRQRATTAMNPILTEQRRKIVQDRSDTKAIINKLQVFLGYAQQAANAGQDSLNVNAPSYVPIDSSPQASVQPAMSSLHTSDSIEPSKTTEDEKPRLPGAKRPIPIIPPPESVKAPAIEVCPKNEMMNNDAVDEWGIKVGQAPPELARQQKQMMTRLMEITESPSPKGSNALRVLQTPRKSYSENDAIAMQSADTDTSDDEASIAKPMQAPPHIEATYELHLDALRLPKGSVSMIKMPNGTTMRVEGESLQRPATATMSDFERRYWTRKPVLTGQPSPYQTPDSPKKSGRPSPHISSPREYRQFSMDRENIAAAPIGHRKAATDAFLAQYNSDDIDRPLSSSSDTESLRDLGLAQNSRNRFILQDIYGTVEQSETDKGLTVSDEQRLQQNPFMVSTNRTPASEQRTHAKMSEDTTLSAESMFNKGYSSVSMQSVHAVAHPPQFVDGPNERGRSAQALLGISKKCKSPRIVQRSGPNGGAWFGPFRRDIAAAESKSPSRVAKPTSPGKDGPQNGSFV